MKTNSRRFARAFTLVEMLAVITIMVILAGLVIGGMGYVADKQARETAKVQINLLSNALEEYKLDMGYYPQGSTAASGTGQSNKLFQALYQEGLEQSRLPAEARSPDKASRIYLAELDPDNNKQGWIQGTGAQAKIVDPWGNEYRYRSALKMDGSSNGSAVQNPDFDLWSIGKDGQHTSASNFDPTNKNNRDDVRNF